MMNMRYTRLNAADDKPDATCHQEDYIGHQRGSIVNISSVGGIHAIGNFLEYYLSVTALDMATKLLRYALILKHQRKIIQW